jgi:demethylmenaquinone methyltransferase / 2-methoxy-6-polyprenyl-1,4-benzoquinol methylase
MAISIYSERETARLRAFESIWKHELDAVFEDVAPYYDRANVFATLGGLDWLRSRFLATVDVGPNDRILDVCAGTNVIGIDLLKREPTLRVSAIDKSAAMQETGRRTASALELKIDSHIGDVHRLPFPDAAFDAVTLQWATRHLRVIEVFSEIRRVLKPGGWLYHCDMLRPANKLVEHAYCGYLTLCVALISRAFRSGAAARRCRRYFTEAIRMFYSTEELSSLMTELGFADVVGKSVLLGTVGFHKARKP